MLLSFEMVLKLAQVKQLPPQALLLWEQPQAQGLVRALPPLP